MLTNDKCKINIPLKFFSGIKATISSRINLMDGELQLLYYEVVPKRTSVKSFLLEVMLGSNTIGFLL